MGSGSGVAEEEGDASEDSDGAGGDEEGSGADGDEPHPPGESLLSELEGVFEEGGCFTPPLPWSEDCREERCERSSRYPGLEPSEIWEDSLLVSLPFDENVGSGFPAVDLSSDDADSLSCPLLSTSIKAELVPLGNEDVELSGVF